MMFLVSLSACSKSKPLTTEDIISHAQEDELRNYQGQTDFFFQSDERNDLVIATIGQDSNTKRCTGVGLVSISTGVARLAIWRGNIFPEIGMKVRITHVGYTDTIGSANGRREEVYLAEPASAE